MPRPRPPHLVRQVTRHGQVVWYVRRGSGPRIRIRGEYGSAEFQASYLDAIAGKPPTPLKGPRTGSLSWLIAQYRESSPWRALAPATRKQREAIFAAVIKSAGDVSFSSIGRKEIQRGRERRSDTPAAARNFLDTMRGLFRWALEAGHCTDDPTTGIRNPPRRGGTGFPVWTEEDIAAFENRWPVGTRERVWFDVLLYTGLRRGDAVRLGRQHVRDGVAQIRTEKSRHRIGVELPILPALAATIAAGPCGELAFIAGERGQPLTKESFGNLFRVACREAGVNKSAHGLRKAGATRAAENGATVAELEAIFGWSGGGMASLYTRSADRARLSRAAMAKLAPNEPQTSIPSPSKKVRE